jgi:hypothetical protein
MSDYKASRLADIPGARRVDPEEIEAFTSAIEEHVIAPLVREMPKQQAALERARRWRFF